ncbi:hypothetical protein LINGRAHAP2_LOCUS28452 [Linum grandiflorum]
MENKLCTEKLDRISTLPDEIIHEILRRLQPSHSQEQVALEHPVQKMVPPRSVLPYNRILRKIPFIQGITTETRRSLLGEVITSCPTRSRQD